MMMVYAGRWGRWMIDVEDNDNDAWWWRIMVDGDGDNGGW